MHFQDLNVENVLRVSLPSDLTKGIVFAVLALFYVFYTRYATPLRKIPGPILASITKLWVVQKTRSFERHNVDIALRKKYGPVVRVAPNEVLVCSPKALRTIYGAANSYYKGEWYSAAGDSGPDDFNLFVENNLEKYRTQRRAIGPAYSAESMKDLEPKIDFIFEKNFKFMRERAGKPIDIDIFCNMLVLDCVAMVTFSKEKGLVEAGGDDGSIRGVHDIWFYIYIAGYFPLVHTTIIRVSHLLRVNWGNTWRKALALLSRDQTSRLKQKNLFDFAIEAVMDRFTRRDNPSSGLSGIQETDILTKLLQLQSEKGVLTDHWVRKMTMANFGAGIDTTAATISVLINNIARRPGLQERVHREIVAARKGGKLSNPPKLGEMKHHLPFLSACLKESIRLSPIIGMPLVRIVPKSGLEIEGYYLPPGTTVGMNPWVLNRDVSLYGDDADEWRPERWLDCTPEELRRLESLNLNFGAGLRSCPGKNLAEAIYTKMIPMLLMEFNWSPASPEKEPFMRCTFSVRLVNEMMVYEQRETSG